MAIMGLIFRLGFVSLGIGTILFLWLDLTFKCFALLDSFPALEKAGIESGLTCLLWLYMQLYFQVYFQLHPIQFDLDLTDSPCFALFHFFPLFVLGVALIVYFLAFWLCRRENG